MAQGITGHILQSTQPKVEHECACRVAGSEHDVLHQQVVEFLQGLVAVFTACQGHFLEHERVATDGALAEDHQVAREDIGALDGDEDRRPLPVPAQVVVRAHDDALAAVHVHGMLDAFTAALGEVVLENRRQHRGLFPQVHGLGGEQAGAVHQPGVAADACQGFLDALERGKRHVELFTDSGVLAGDQAGVLGRPRADGG